MFEDAKRSLKKCYGSGSISNSTTKTIPFDNDKSFLKQEDRLEYESFLAWKRNQRNEHNSDCVGENFEEHDSYVGWKKTKQGKMASKDKGKSSNVNKKFHGKHNPIGNKGYPLQCHVCRSITHFEEDCPHSESNKSSKTLVVGSSSVIECDVSDVYVGDSMNYMILDTGCPHNVAGKVWFQCYFDSLSVEERNSVEKCGSFSKLKFGGGCVFDSLFKVKMPVCILNTKIVLEFDVVESDIPLLCGKNTMRQWGLIINTKTETTELMLNGSRKIVDLCTSKSGHWCLSLQSPLSIMNACESYFSVASLSRAEKKNAAIHVHRQFCHPPYRFLEKVLKSMSNVVDEEFLVFLKAHSEECLVCKRYKRSLPKPAVGNFIDPEKACFNDVVTADLKHRNGRLILYMIDTFSRYTRASFVGDKCPQTIVSMMISINIWEP